MTRFATIVLAIGLLLGQDPKDKPVDLDTAMMNSTFRLYGPSVSEPGKNWTGTGFLIGRPFVSNPQTFYLIGITAAHVLSNIFGDWATVVIRTKDSGGRLQRGTQPLRIRTNGQPSWTQHPSQDIAAFYIRLPLNHSMTVTPLEYLATDDSFKEFDFHPGDEVTALGYPFGYEVNEFGFPVLKSGRIASYPLIPVRELKHFVIDLAAFGGNSGGPVYLSSQNRTYNNAVHLGGNVFRVIGLVTQNLTSPDQTQNIGLTRVVHAEFIRETIDRLPYTPPGPTEPMARRP